MSSSVNSATQFDFQAGEVLLVNKPLRWTSFDVVNKLRHAIQKAKGIKKIKVGHAGTLDPLADGLLLVCTGRKTKTITALMGLKKTYTGTITLGAETPSYDLETEINRHCPTDHLSDELIRATARDMEGRYPQYPPPFSAKKIAGKRAYHFARKGETVALQPKEVSVHSFEIKRIDGVDVSFRIDCSKGTYIRSIAHDFGKRLQSGAHLSGLRREAIGAYSLDGALTVSEWVSAIQSADGL